MRNYQPVDATIFRATLQTANESDLGNEVAVFLNGHSVATHCFRCLGSIFRALPETTDVACSYCRAIYQTQDEVK
jgi:hypothetical protein